MEENRIPKSIRSILRLNVPRTATVRNMRDVGELIGPDFVTIVIESENNTFADNCINSSSKEDWKPEVGEDVRFLLIEEDGFPHVFSLKEDEGFDLPKKEE